MAKKAQGKKKAAKRPTGRRSKFRTDIAEEICRRLSNGESLRGICRAERLPSEAAVRGWVRDDVGGFASHYARARDDASEGYVDELISIADASGDARLRVDARKWVVSKLLPKKYGDRLALDHGGEVKTTASDADVARKVALLLAKATARQVRAEVTEPTGGNGRD
jgi:hypothetical protein